MKLKFSSILITSLLSTNLNAETLEAPTIKLDVSGTRVTVYGDDVLGAEKYNLYYAPYPFTGESTIRKLTETPFNNNSMLKTYSVFEGASFYLAYRSVQTVNGVEVESGFSNPVLFKNLQPLEYWEEKPIVLREEMEYHECPETWNGVTWNTRWQWPRKTTVIAVIPTDINGDKWKDLLYFTTCQPGYGREALQEIWGPAYSTVLAYVSDEFGNYRIANEEVFGERLPMIDGFTGAIVQEDFNGDGITDYIAPPNREDGRAFFPGEPDHNRDGYPTAIMSDGPGKYVVEILDNIETRITPWWMILKNNFGGKDLMFAGGKRQIIRYVNHGWVDVTEEYESIFNFPEQALWSITALNIEDKYIIVGGNYASESGEFNRNGTGLAGYTLLKNINGVWEIVDNRRDPLVEEVEIDIGGGNMSLEKIYAYEDTFTTTRFPHETPDPCIISDYVQDNDLYLFTFHTNKVDLKSKSVTGRDEYFYYGNMQDWQGFFIINDKLVDVSEIVKEKDEGQSSNFGQQCIDANGDGKTDIFGKRMMDSDYPFGGRGLLYLNDGNGFVDTQLTHGNILPMTSMRERGISQLTDINSDGIIDVVIYANHPATYVPGNAEMTEDNQNDVEIYLGIKPLEEIYE